MSQPASMTPSAPIGVFDSGVGGLSVLRQIRQLMPSERLIYVADSGHAPYGDRHDDYISERSRAIAEFFISRGVKAMVIACNTATAVAAPALRARHALPIVAMEPALKPAAAMTRSGVIGVLATSRTLASERLALLQGKYGRDVKVLLQACPGFVEQVEKAQLLGPQAEALVARHVLPLVQQGADTLVLGCTHYPFLAAAIRAVAGPQVNLVDPSPAVARELRRRLDGAALLAPAEQAGSEHFHTSGEPLAVSHALSKLWGAQIELLPLPHNA